MWFVSKPFHPNIWADGEISTKALRKYWTPASNIVDLLKMMSKIFASPSLDYVVNAEAAKLYQESHLSYNHKVRQSVKASLEQAWSLLQF